MRRLSADERALWRKVVASVRPLAGSAPLPDTEPPVEPQPDGRPAAAAKPASLVRAQGRRSEPGTTLDASWDRRLSRGLVVPDLAVDLHGHSLAAAHALLERRLEQAIADGARVMLLITGKAPRDERRPVLRGAIRAAVGDWIAASPHAAEIAAVRGAHRRHGGAGALYIVLRRRRSPP